MATSLMHSSWMIVGAFALCIHQHVSRSAHRATFVPFPNSTSRLGPAASPNRSISNRSNHRRSVAEEMPANAIL